MTIVEVTAAPFGAGHAGGGERHADEFIRELSRYEPTVASYAVRSPGAAHRSADLACPARFLSLPPILTETNPIPKIAAWGLIGSYLRSHRGDVEFVHVHNLRTAFSTLWLLLAYLRKKDDRIRILLTDLGARFFPLPRTTAAMVDYFVPISHYSEALLRQLASRPSCVVPTAVSAEFLAGTVRPFSERDIDLLYVGRFVPWKRPDRVLDLAVEVGRRLGRNAKTVLAGAVVDPAYLTELKRKAVRLGIAESVRFVERPTDPELVELYSNAKLYCLASDSTDTHGHHHPAPELSSITVLEAAARGTPALANRIPAALEQVQDGVTGYLVDGFGGPTTVELAERLINDAGTWGPLSHAARGFVERERTYPATVAVFRSFLGRVRAGAA